MNAVEIYEKASWDIEHNKITLGEFEERIKPLYDVEPVRHGRWLRVGQSYIDPNKFLCFECSICRCTLDNHIKVEQNYCPNCGARMGGESNAKTYNKDYPCYLDYPLTEEQEHE